MMKINLFTFMLFLPFWFVVYPAFAEPALSEILAACEYLEPGDIPIDSFTPPSNAIYVAPAVNGGDDNNTGLSIDSPFAHLDKAIDYANQDPDTPLTIYLREGIYYFKDPQNHTDNPYLSITRGNLYITAYNNETITIRPYYWPGNPTEWGDERVFEINNSSSNPISNITFDHLHFEGWNTIFTLSSALDQPPLSSIVIKNVSASQFTSRDVEGMTTFLDTGYIDSDVYGEDKVIFDNPEEAKYQIEGLILSNISVEGAYLVVNIGDENDANVKGLRISHFSLDNPDATSGNSASDAFAIVNSYKVLIDHCRIVNINDDGIDTKSFNVSVVNTYIQGTGRNAVKFWRNGEIINTILYDCTEINDGAIIVKTGPFRMINSVLLNHPIGFAGTYAYDESSPVNTKCEIVNSVIGHVNSFYLNTTNYKIYNNRFSALLDDSIPFSGAIDAPAVSVLNALPFAGGNELTTIQFSNPGKGDFSLLPDSTWIDAGKQEDVLLPSFDYLGNPRISGTSVDIGPIEYQTTRIPVWELY